ncbi:MAG: DNA polymerase III subunit gamma/tau [Archangium sp.]
MNRVLPAPVPVATSAEGCASGDCLPEEKPVQKFDERPEPPPPDEPPPDFDEEPPAPIAAAPARAPSSDDDRWRRAVDAIRDASPRHGKSLSYARFLGFTPEGVKLAFPPDAAFHRSQIIGMSRAMIEGELTKSLGRPIKLLEDTSAAALQSAPKSIAEVEASDRSSREKTIEQKVRAHPALKNVIRHLGGALEHIAYLEPVSRPSGAPAAASSSDEGDAGPAVD